MQNPDYARTIKKGGNWFSLVFVFMVVAGICFGLYWLFTKDNNVKEETSSESVVDLTKDEEDSTSGEEENIEDEDSEDNEEDESSSNDNSDENTEDQTDFSEFSTTSQSLGSQADEDSETEYSLNRVTDSSENGFHRFVFELESKDNSLESPYVEARYLSSNGSIRVDLNMTTSDSSGIGYQEARSIDKEGVIRLYHNVSSDQTEELYDVGISSETTFYLYGDDKGNGVWEVILEVKYPGESNVDIDTGSSDFSKEDQSIEGAGVEDGSKVTAYSYTATGGILRVIFTVSGSSTEPIPSAAASYEDSGSSEEILTLRFTEIYSDTVAKMPAALSMPGGITMVWQMNGSNESVYTFEGATKEFKLTAGTNPNQVILEIQL